MSNPPKSTIGQAIDQTMNALSSLDKREQQIVISTVCSILGVAQTGVAPSPAGVVNQPPRVTPPAPPTGPHAEVTPQQGAVEKPVHESSSHAVDIRALRDEKQPSSAVQMACIVAYYLQELAPEAERTKDITTAELERLFKQAKFKLPVRVHQVLVDGKGAGYFESVERGKYRLTRVGYNLVTHSLPKAAAA